MSTEGDVVYIHEVQLSNRSAMTDGDGCPLEMGNYSIVAYADEYLYPPGEAVLITVIMPIIWAIGAISNIAFIFVVARIRRMRTVTNFYLLNLAVADIMFLCCAVGEKLGRYAASPIYNDQFNLKPVGCVLVNFFVQLSFYGSIFLVTLVTLEKYYAVCRPVQHRLISGNKRTIRTIAAAWLLAIAFAAILIPAWANWTRSCLNWPDIEKYNSLPKIFATCRPLSVTYAYFSNGMQTIPFFVVLVLNLLMYVFIIRAVNTRVVARENHLASSVARRVRIRDQVVRMLVVNGIIFFICLAPLQIFSFASMIIGILEAVTDSSFVINHEEQILWTCRIFSYINSAINPFVYAFTNPRYRQAFMEAFACCHSLKRHLLKKARVQENGSSNVSTDQTATMKRLQIRKESMATTDSQLSKSRSPSIIANDVAI
ncbi:cholecystokinin receptor type A-like [Lytechinus variegatus]|uniref:cholecystokinin receptor type A-like n=1 Tax=Lytechinus variegatus TaxID=7654 RepID=UPI001BB28619|nr:cholecystokinin receptor type A-like [Lytechinus variegatus]